MNNIRSHIKSKCHAILLYLKKLDFKQLFMILILKNVKTINKVSEFFTKTEENLHVTDYCLGDFRSLTGL